MKNKTWTINNKQYEKLDKTQAEKAYLSGITICLCPAHCNPNFIGAPLCNINIHGEDDSSFTSKVNNYIYYNYTSGIGWKKYAWYFVKRKDGDLIAIHESYEQKFYEERGNFY